MPIEPGCLPLRQIRMLPRSRKLPGSERFIGPAAGAAMAIDGPLGTTLRRPTRGQQPLRRGVHRHTDAAGSNACSAQRAAAEPNAICVETAAPVVIEAAYADP